ncbi:MAG TPA: hypothetical protein VG293_05755 [Solirubrobacteraceae bacterium]|nr:hypothetical protein [Solirubrobacteraceae bacterium]
MAVELEERDQRDQRLPLVAVDEGLGLGDAMREDGGLQREVSLLIVRVSGWASQRSLKGARLRR